MVTKDAFAELVKRVQSDALSIRAQHAFGFSRTLSGFVVKTLSGYPHIQIQLEASPSLTEAQISFVYIRDVDRAEFRWTRTMIVEVEHTEKRFDSWLAMGAQRFGTLQEASMALLAPSMCRDFTAPADVDGTVPQSAS